MGQSGMGHPGMQMGNRQGKVGNQRAGNKQRGGMGAEGNSFNTGTGGQMTDDYGENSQQQEQLDFYITTYEICFIVFTILFVFNVFIGKARNYKFAKTWYFSNKQYLFNNYSHIGVIIDKKKEAIALMKDSYSTYKIYSSGRINCKWLMCSLEVISD